MVDSCGLLRHPRLLYVFDRGEKSSSMPYMVTGRGTNREHGTQKKAISELGAWRLLHRGLRLQNRERNIYLSRLNTFGTSFL